MIPLLDILTEVTLHGVAMDVDCQKVEHAFVEEHMYIFIKCVAHCMQ